MGTFKINFKIREKVYTSEQIEPILDTVMVHALRKTKKQSIDWILKYVPVRTGQLRDSLISWIQKSWNWTPIGMMLDLETYVDYALDITGLVKHFNTWFEHNGKPAVAFYYDHSGYILLDDPNAELMWHILIKDFVLNKLKLNMNIETNNILGA